MHEIPMAAAVSQAVLVTFFTIFSGIVWWLYIRSGNESLEQHRYDVIPEEKHG